MKHRTPIDMNQQYKSTKVYWGDKGLIIVVIVTSNIILNECFKLIGIGLNQIKNIS